MPARFAALGGWAEDDHAAALTAFRKSCGPLLKLPADAPVGPSGIGGRAGAWQDACRAPAADRGSDGSTARTFFEKWFRPYAVISSKGAPEGLFTGYFEPELRGALTRGGRYRVPLYGRPADLVTVPLGPFDDALAGRTLVGQVRTNRVVPYPARHEIESGALGDRARPILWVDSAIDAFFLHVQGSGAVTLEDGKVVRVGFAASNGRPYTAIGRVLADRGAIPRGRVSMQSIRSWLAAHPAQAGEIMARNERYVFFRRLDGHAPVGAQGVELTADRSLAVDRDLLPLGAPVWVETRDPLDPAKPLRRLMVAQDTGAAIKGAVRGDIFFGRGQLAARRAGLMKQTGRYYILLPRNAGPAS